MKEKAVQEVMERLKRPFRAEIRAGCLNTAVFGGFDRYVTVQLEQLRSLLDPDAKETLTAVGMLKQLFLDYRRIGPEDRLEVIREAISLIQVLERLLQTAPEPEDAVPEMDIRLDRSAPADLVEPADERTISPDTGPMEVSAAADGKDRTESLPAPIGRVRRSRKSDAAEGRKPSAQQPASVAALPGIPTMRAALTDGEQRKILDRLEKLARSVQFVKGIGPKRVQILKRLNVEAILDLLYYLPREYSDRSEILPIAEVKDADGEVTVVGNVVAVQEVRPGRGMRIVKVAIHDGTGLAFGVWFNQPYIKDQFKVDDQVVFSGKMNQKNFNRYRKIELSNPVFEKVEAEDTVHTRRIVPMYSLTEGLNQKQVREMVKNAVDAYVKEMPELIPEEFRRKFGLMAIEETLRFVHFPENRALLEEAKRRLIFEDFFLLQLGILYQRTQVRRDVSGFACGEDGELLTRFIRLLPFDLTAAQQRVWTETAADMRRTTPMHRLLQGDVGSGKTVVAAMTLLKGIENDLQGALMAPTEILAEQHYISLQKWFAALELRVALLTGSLKKREREEILTQLRNGELNLVIGTHALIQEDVEFARLGVVVIDEQHRFGVRQREELREKGFHPHLLVMTATPIPRSMALTIYGDLDLSVIDELPPGRKPVMTVWRGPEARDKIYAFVKEQLDQGYQAYVVCPLIDESDLLDVESATRTAEFLAEEVFYAYRVALLTGQTPGDDRDAIMRSFRDGELDILVATTVIEVGVDVPNANVMLIEDAQRFGLAQLHQLRGRVGRGSAQSYCILIGDPSTPEGERRLRVMTETTDGFKIAEEDLAIRGPGEFFGTRQHGLPEFKVANLIRDWEVLEMVRAEVKEMLGESPDWIRSDLLKIILAMRFKGSFLTED